MMRRGSPAMMQRGRVGREQGRDESSRMVIQGHEGETKTTEMHNSKQPIRINQRSGAV